MLDLHNLTGVFALPFHALILLSGLLILFPLCLPAAIVALYPGQASLDGMLAQARQQWGGDEPVFLRVWHLGDANAYVRSVAAWPTA
ncbi:hypothetical protein D3C81_1607220 [compost metagenome]